MKSKENLRKKFLSLRKKKYYDVPPDRFNSLIKYIKKKYKSKKYIYIAIYYPSNYEINLLKIFDNFKEKKFITLLPVVNKNGLLNFVEWKNQDIMVVNKYGIPEPIAGKKAFLPDVILAPLIAFDKYNNRLGYGKGYYDIILDDGSHYLNDQIRAAQLWYDSVKPGGLYIIEDVWYENIETLSNLYPNANSLDLREERIYKIVNGVKFYRDDNAIIYWKKE